MGERLYIIPWPWDYHGHGKLVILASSSKEAHDKAVSYTVGRSMSWGGPPLYEEMFEAADDVIECEGCDC